LETAFASLAEALVLAIVDNQPQLVALLAEAGARINALTPAARKPLDLARAVGAQKVTAALLKVGAQEVRPEELGLADAVTAGYLERAEELIPAASGPEHRAGFFAAVELGHFKILPLLAAALTPAQVHGQLAIAASRGHLEVTRALLNLGAEAGKPGQPHPPGPAGC
jgi:hypothetical protein